MASVDSKGEERSSAITVKPVSPKLEAELAHTELLQLKYLRLMLERAATTELASAEEDVLRGWEQVQGAVSRNAVCVLRE
jgi:hypothetical protein